MVTVIGLRANKRAEARFLLDLVTYGADGKRHTLSSPSCATTSLSKTFWDTLPANAEVVQIGKSL